MNSVFPSSALRTVLAILFVYREHILKTGYVPFGDSVGQLARNGSIFDVEGISDYIEFARRALKFDDDNRDSPPMKSAAAQHKIDNVDKYICKLAMLRLSNADESLPFCASKFVQIENPCVAGGEVDVQKIGESSTTTRPARLNRMAEESQTPESSSSTESSTAESAQTTPSSTFSSFVSTNEPIRSSTTTNANPFANLKLPEHINVEDMLEKNTDGPPQTELNSSEVLISSAETTRTSTESSTTTSDINSTNPRGSEDEETTTGVDSGFLGLGQTNKELSESTDSSQTNESATAIFDNSTTFTESAKSTEPLGAVSAGKLDESTASAEMGSAETSTEMEKDQISTQTTLIEKISSQFSSEATSELAQKTDQTSEGNISTPPTTESPETSSKANPFANSKLPEHINVEKLLEKSNASDGDNFDESTTFMPSQTSTASLFTTDSTTNGLTTASTESNADVSATIEVSTIAGNETTLIPQSSTTERELASTEPAISAIVDEQRSSEAGIRTTFQETTEQPTFSPQSQEQRLQIGSFASTDEENSDDGSEADEKLEDPQLACSDSRRGRHLSEMALADEWRSQAPIYIAIAPDNSIVSRSVHEFEIKRRNEGRNNSVIHIHARMDIEVVQNANRLEAVFASHASSIFVADLENLTIVRARKLLRVPFRSSTYGLGVRNGIVYVAVSPHHSIVLVDLNTLAQIRTIRVPVEHAIEDIVVSEQNDLILSTSDGIFGVDRNDKFLGLLYRPVGRKNSTMSTGQMQLTNNGKTLWIMNQPCTVTVLSVSWEPLTLAKIGQRNFGSRTRLCTGLAIGPTIESNKQGKIRSCYLYIVDALRQRIMKFN